MNLPFIKKNSSPPRSSREYFLALEIDHGLVKSAIWSVINDKAQVLSVGQPSPWDDQTQASLTTAADQSITDCTSKLDPEGKTLPQKIILGLPSNWLTADKITSHYLDFLKHLIPTLSLKAIGFVVNQEAMVKFLHSSEGVHPTAVLIGVWPLFLEITLVRLGKIVDTHLVTRSPAISSDVVEGLSRFTNLDMLPSRLLLYNSGTNLDDIKQQLLAHPWQAPQTRLPFLHFPKIECLPSDFTIRAIALSGGTEVARAIGLISQAPPAVSTPQDLGFSDTDPPPSPASPPPLISPPSKPRPPHPSLPRLSLPKLTFPRLWFLPLIIVVLVSILAALYWYLPKATVTLQVTPKTLGTELNLIADTAVTALDEEKLIIPSRVSEISQESSRTAPTTGSNLVGDKAVGTVSVINGTTTPKTLPVGTVITSPSGLKFTLDSAVEVASASGTADPNSYQPGRVDNVKATASKIGSDSNLSAGTQFRVGSYATLDLVAKNEAAFSGGNSKQVKAVSSSDLSRLRSDLVSSLKSETEEKLKSQLTSDQLLIPETLQSQVDFSQFNHKEGDTADEITLKLTLTSKAYAISRLDLNNLVLARLRSQIPAGFASSGASDQSFTVKKTVGSATHLTAQITSSLLPQLDPQDISAQLAGKSLASGRSYLESLPAVSHVDLVMNLRLPVFPLLPRHISIEISKAP